MWTLNHLRRWLDGASFVCLLVQSSAWSCSVANGYGSPLTTRVERSCALSPNSVRFVIFSPSEVSGTCRSSNCLDADRSSSSCRPTDRRISKWLARWRSARSDQAVDSTSPGDRPRRLFDRRRGSSSPRRSESHRRFGFLRSWRSTNCRSSMPPRQSTPTASESDLAWSIGRKLWRID
jgi:hypothetical protein